MEHAAGSPYSRASLVSCNSAAYDEPACDDAKQAVLPVLAERFRGVPVEVATAWISYYNASTVELPVVALDDVSGASTSATKIVANIPARAETIECLLGEGAALAGSLQ